VKTLYVLYDRECSFCDSCRSWLCRQSAFIDLRFVPTRSAAAAERFPGLEKIDTGGDLVVISDEGAVYRGTSAYLMCLYALREYREWALRLSAPALLPLTRRVFKHLSEQRSRISRWFFEKTPQQLEEELGPEAVPVCSTRALERTGSRSRLGQE
jgi:predicted DCC family thiol-disulfide oxidoreductase YuxK